MDLQNLFMIAIVLGAFWFLIIRPQQQRQRQHAEMVSKLEPGVEIVTIGGIYATIVATGERIRVRVADGTELEIAPQAVGRVLASGELAENDEAPEADSKSPDEMSDVTDNGTKLP